MGENRIWWAERNGEMGKQKDKAKDRNTEAQREKDFGSPHTPLEKSPTL